MMHKNEMYVVIKGCGINRSNEGPPPVSLAEYVDGDPPQASLACAFRPENPGRQGKTVAMDVTPKSNGLPYCFCREGCLWARDSSVFSNAWVALPKGVSNKS